MARPTAKLHWRRGTAGFGKGHYPRAHVWHFDGGATVHASASPDIVPAPWSDASAVDPEEAFVAALASCHMLWFLSLASAKGFVVDSYEDEAVATMREIAPGKPMVAEVVLRPCATFDSAHAATREQLDALHHEAHERCFLANSVRTKIRVEVR
ncbi:MAG: OsmC family protein [Proteobacteria bacterium]|nr:OsmC family protein [Pseudomonadota bacterium]